MTMVSPLVIGCFGRAVGVLGWIKVVSLATPKEHILDFKPWLIRKHNLWEEVYPEDNKNHAGNIIVKLPNCHSPEEARHFTNIDIGVWREQLPKLYDQEYYWVDLIGLEIINKDGINLGIVQSVMATGSNDVLVVEGERKRLIPYISNVISKVDLTNKVIYVDWGEDFL